MLHTPEERHLAAIQLTAWSIAESKGFHNGRGNSRDDTLVRLVLIHSEVSEAVQIVKRYWTDNVSEIDKIKLADELADVLIRLADLAGCLDINLEEAVLRKLEINRKRPFLYGTPRETPSSSGDV